MKLEFFFQPYRIWNFLRFNADKLHLFVPCAMSIVLANHGVASANYTDISNNAPPEFVPKFVVVHSVP